MAEPTDSSNPTVRSSAPSGTSVARGTGNITTVARAEAVYNILSKEDQSTNNPSGKRRRSLIATVGTAIKDYKSAPEGSREQLDALTIMVGTVGSVADDWKEPQNAKPLI